MKKISKIAVRARLFWFVADPVQASGQAYRYIDDGLLHVEGGLVCAAGEASELLPQLANDVTLIDHRPHLVMPGFIDAHIHFPQTQVIASYGEQLLDWLQKYTFPAEMRYADPALAALQARFFVDTLLNHGTTTAVVYGSVHPQSAEAFFVESERANTRMIAGKVMMDRNAPDGLLDTAQRGYDESEALIGKWHRRGRQLYAITPRFAITSTVEQLQACGALVKAYPDCYMQTHISENLREIELAQSLFPAAADYTDIYDTYGLLGPR
ncbi:MAG: guanine deaminase, partial [Hyphomicrobiales bacterium]|nr:guanine deaminase [Hyphomicrobiales bacterium]